MSDKGKVSRIEWFEGPSHFADCLIKSGTKGYTFLQTIAEGKLVI